MKNNQGYILGLDVGFNELEKDNFTLSILKLDDLRQSITLINSYKLSVN